ncbi:MAG: hypothetical protein AAFR60_08575, partial [Pseudomonadota bacterium]
MRHVLAVASADGQFEISLRAVVLASQLADFCTDLAQAGRSRMRNAPQGSVSQHALQDSRLGSAEAAFHVVKSSGQKQRAHRLGLGALSADGILTPAEAEAVRALLLSGRFDDMERRFRR